MKPAATSVSFYLEELPPDRREAIEIVRNKILRRLPEGYEETMGFGMITYRLKSIQIPYNKQPLMSAALANQKNHMALYLSAI